MYDFERVKNQSKFAREYSVSMPRLRRLIATRNSLRNRVADFIRVDSSTLQVKTPPTKMAHSKLTLLRVLQVWCFHDSLIESIHVSEPVGNSYPVFLSKNKVNETHLLQVLDKERHDFVLENKRCIDQKGKLTLVGDQTFNSDDFMDGFEGRFISYGIEKGIDVMWYQRDEIVTLLAPLAISTSVNFANLKNELLSGFTMTTLYMKELRGKNLRGRNTRSAGLWIRSVGSSDDCIQVIRWVTVHMQKEKTLKLQRTDHVASTISCVFSGYMGAKANIAKANFNLMLRGKCDELSKQDLTDIFATPEIEYKTNETGQSSQRVCFALTRNTPIGYDGSRIEELSFDGIDSNESSSWNRPILNDIPEGARLLSVLASSRRNQHSVILCDDNDGDNKGNGAGDKNFVEVSLDRKETKLSERWKRFGTNRKVYVPVNCVPAFAQPLGGASELFACCANTLEVSGGGLRVECLTILPPGRLFVLLAFLTFGMQPFSLPLNDNSDNSNTLVVASLEWLGKIAKNGVGVGKAGAPYTSQVNCMEKIELALSFRDSCQHLGEELKCFPDKVVELLRIFDSVDGNHCVPWGDIDCNPSFSFPSVPSPGTKARKLTRPVTEYRKDVASQNAQCPKSTSKTKSDIALHVEKPLLSMGAKDIDLPQSAKSKDTTSNKVAVKKMKSPPQMNRAKISNKVAVEEVKSPPPKNRAKISKKVVAEEAKSPPLKNRAKILSAKGAIEPVAHTAVLVDLSSKTMRERAASLFMTEEVTIDAVKIPNFPSTNILCLLVNQYLLLRNNTLESCIASEQAGAVLLNDKNWNVLRVKIGPKLHWRYLADYIGDTIPFPLSKRDYIIPALPIWIKNKLPRPQSAMEAFACIPPQFATMAHWETTILLKDGVTENVVLFNSLESALRMGSAFWMEQQFYDGQRHWYQQTLSEMVAKATVPSSNLLHEHSQF